MIANVQQEFQAPSAVLPWTEEQYSDQPTLTNHNITVRGKSCSAGFSILSHVLVPPHAIEIKEARPCASPRPQSVVMSGRLPNRTPISSGSLGTSVHSWQLSWRTSRSLTRTSSWAGISSISISRSSRCAAPNWTYGLPLDATLKQPASFRLASPGRPRWSECPAAWFSTASQR